MKALLTLIILLGITFTSIGQNIQVKLLTTFSEMKELEKQVNRIYGDRITTLPSNRWIIITNKEITRPILRKNGSTGQQWIWGNSNPEKGIGIVTTTHLPTNSQIITTFLHELGHIHMLKHCINTKCLMRRTRGFTLHSSYYLCDNCKKLIK